MPFYEYECQACGHHHEAMQKMGEAPLRRCPHCGRSRLKRLISAPAFRLKGGGWYETDFKSGQETKRNLHAEDQAGKTDTADTGADKGADKGADGAKPVDAAPAAKNEGKSEAAAAPPAAAETPARSTAKRSTKRSPAPAARRSRRASRKPAGRR